MLSGRTAPRRRGATRPKQRSKLRSTKKKPGMCRASCWTPRSQPAEAIRQRLHRHAARGLDRALEEAQVLRGLRHRTRQQHLSDALHEVRLLQPVRADAAPCEAGEELRERRRLLLDVAHVVTARLA